MPAIARTAAALALCAALLAPAATSAAPSEPAIPAQAAPSPEEALGGIAPAFEANLGQADPRAHYLLRAGGTGMFFTPSGVRISLADAGGLSQRWGLRMGFAGARAVPEPTGALPGAVSYFKGSPDEWVTGAPTYEGLTYRGLWEGVDLVFRSGADALKYDLIVAPGADPSQVAMRWRGATSLELMPSGALKVSTPAGSIVDAPPRAWQRVRGRRINIPARYALDGETVSFVLEDYDSDLPITIDPAIFVFAGYIGGSPQPTPTGDATVEGAYAIDVTETGAAYVAGQADSGAFPASVGPDLSHNGGSDVFIAKVRQDGTGLEYSGYIGGSGLERATGVAVDAAGSAYITGEAGSTESHGFPVTVGPELTHGGGFEDAFVAKVRPDGSGLEYAGYVGGSSIDWAGGIDVDSAGAAYLAGYTQSTEATGFPVLAGPDLTYNDAGSGDAFVAKVRPDGTGLEYAGYIGGSEGDAASKIAVDGSGAAYVAGLTYSAQDTFPVSVGPDVTQNGGQEGFVAKVRPDGTGLEYAGYIGGSESDAAASIAVDDSGSAYVTGGTRSTQDTFPVSLGPDVTHNGGTDAFVAKVRPDGAGLSYAGYIGGAKFEIGSAIALDDAGAVYIAGGTSSPETSFPAKGGPDSAYSEAGDAFVAKIRPDGTQLEYSGYIGGSDVDFAFGIAVDAAASAYVAGTTASTEATFPTVGGPDLTHNGGTDAFVAKVATTESCMGKPVTHLGGPGDDTITGTPGDDVVLAGDGNDTIETLGGDDLVCAGGGNDTVKTAGGKDSVFGGPGKDKVRGGSGKDKLAGQAGKDRLLGQGGPDLVKGGGGRDTVKGGSGNDRVKGQGGKDNVRGQGGKDKLWGGGGPDKLVGGAGEDILKGQKGNDNLNGGADTDTCRQQAGTGILRNCER